MKSAGRKIESEFRIEVANSSPDQPEHGADNTDPEKNGDFADGLNAAVKKNDQENDQAAGNGFGLPASQRMEITGVAREADRGRSNGKRSGHKDLPDKQERHHAAPAAGPVGFAQEYVGAACFGHRCA